MLEKTKHTWFPTQKNTSKTYITDSRNVLLSCARGKVNRFYHSHKNLSLSLSLSLTHTHTHPLTHTHTLTHTFFKFPMTVIFVSDNTNQLQSMLKEMGLYLLHNMRKEIIKTLEEINCLRYLV